MLKILPRGHNNLTVQWHAGKSDKLGESAWIRVVFRNGEIYLKTEKYKNVNYSRKAAQKLAEQLCATYVEFDLRKKK